MNDFTQDDFASATWLRLRAYYEARLATLRAKNDNPLTPEDSARLRGRIKECKSFLALAFEKPAPSESDDA